jgi:hypothetical protein
LSDDNRVTVALVGLLVLWSASRTVFAFTSTWRVDTEDIAVLIVFLTKYYKGMLCPFSHITKLLFFYLQSILLSVNDLLACCGFMCGDGCDGGYPIEAWRYFVQNGVVTDEV